jgi:hypothetical protein
MYPFRYRVSFCAQQSLREVSKRWKEVRGSPRAWAAAV